MRASFVLVNYNRKDELLITIEKTKELIKASPEDYEIVVVDNASVDGSANAMKTSHPDVILIENPVNTGAPAWNLGFARAKGDYFIIIDDDSHIVSGLQEALNYIDSKPDIGVLALNILTGPYTSKGWGWRDGHDIVGFIGCGAIYRKSVYDQIGGYADWIFLYANEWDLGIRCIDAGYRVEYFAKCKVNHRTSSINRTGKRLSVLGTKHEMAIIYKHFGKSRWKYITRMALNRLKGLRKGNFKDTYYIMIGYYEFLKMRKSLPHTPVSLASQKKFTEHFADARFVIGFLRRWIYWVLRRAGKPVKQNAQVLLKESETLKQ